MLDLRVVNQDFEETPYFLLIKRAQSRRNWLTGRLAETSFIPNEYNRLVVDSGTEKALHNRIEIRLDETDFFSWAEVAVSDDAKQWRIVRGRAPIYRFETEDASSSTISYPDVRSRWIRVKILYGERQLRVQNCRIAQEMVEEAEYVDLPLTLVAFHQSSSDSYWQVDAGVREVPVSAVTFQAEQPEFHRAVRVDVSQDGNKWRPVGRGSIYRIRASEPDSEGADQLRSSMRVEFPERRGRFWRVNVLNRNDRPVTGLRPTLQMESHRIYWRQEPGSSYWLLYGNSRVKGSEYDLRKVFSGVDLERVPSGRLGMESVNTNYVSPEPWTERHPAVLWVALIAAVVVLGVLALRSLRQ
jgi:hypothetical protein